VRWTPAGGFEVFVDDVESGQEVGERLPAITAITDSPIAESTE